MDNIIDFNEFKNRIKTDNGMEFEATALFENISFCNKLISILLKFENSEKFV
jgi:hypothetical protein